MKQIQIRSKSDRIVGSHWMEVWIVVFWDETASSGIVIDSAWSSLSRASKREDELLQSDQASVVKIIRLDLDRPQKK
jgi:hypothetical protein